MRRRLSTRTAGSRPAVIQPPTVARETPERWAASVTESSPVAAVAIAARVGRPRPAAIMANPVGACAPPPLMKRTPLPPSGMSVPRANEGRRWAVATLARFRSRRQIRFTAIDSRRHRVRRDAMGVPALDELAWSAWTRWRRTPPPPQRRWRGGHGLGGRYRPPHRGGHHAHPIAQENHRGVTTNPDPAPPIFIARESY